MSNNETLADIIAEMRNRAARREISPEVYGLADRIEAAAKRDAAIHALTCEANERLREHLEIALEGKQGNAAAMRRVLLNAKARFASLALTNSEWRTCAEEYVREIAAALSAPPRNCDVGTPETQVVRMAAYCRSHQDTEVTLCKRCPIKCDNWFLCALRWAQMPYEEGGAE